MSPSPLDVHHAVLAGAGNTAIVFAHGFGCDRHIWRSVAPPLSAGCRTMVYDHAGCGNSVAAWQPERHRHLQGYADDLLSLLDAAGFERSVAVAIRWAASSRCWRRWRSRSASRGWCCWRLRRAS